MGSQIITLTKGVTYVKSSGGSGLDDAVEVLGFSSTRLVLKLIGVDNGSTPRLAVLIQTSMSLRDVENAPVVGVFFFTDEKGMAMAQTFTGLLRYVWWTAMSFSGQADGFQFTLEGVAYD